MIQFLILIVSLWTVALGALKGCEPSTILGNGFDVNFYRYPLRGEDFRRDPNYYIEGYKKYGFLQTVPNVSEINFSTNVPGGQVARGRVYGYDITVSNFTMSIGGYFLATQTGNYTFNMYADDGGFLQIGAGESCCGEAVEDASGDSFKAVWPSTANAQIALEAGVYYPIKMVFVNWNGPSGLELRYVAPDGQVTTDMGSQIYQMRQLCTRTTTRTWTGSETSTFTRTESLFESVVVEVPTPTQTVTTYWTGIDTTATTLVGSVGQNNTVLVQVPRVLSTSYWSNTYTSTTTVTPSAGGQPTVIVNLPSAQTTSLWTGSFTTTSAITGSDGQTTPVVLVPYPSSTWTGSYTTTSAVTGADGQTTPVVLVPSSASSSTWTGSFTTTSDLKGADGQVTPCVLIPSVMSLCREGSSSSCQGVSGEIDSARYCEHGCIERGSSVDLCSGFGSCGSSMHSGGVAKNEGEAGPMSLQIKTMDDNGPSYENTFVTPNRQSTMGVTSSLVANDVAVNRSGRESNSMATTAQVTDVHSGSTSIVSQADPSAVSILEGGSKSAFRVSFLFLIPLFVLTF